MKKIVNLLFLLPLFGIAQVVITEKSVGGTLTPDPSAALEVRHDKKGILFPEVPLTSVTDVTTIANPVEGLSVINTTLNTSNPNIPAKNPAITVWDGSKWLFYTTAYDNNASLDLVKTFVAKSRDDAPVVFTSPAIPSTAPQAVLGEGLGTTWKVLIDSQDAINGQAYFDLPTAEATHSMVIDAEGMATINSGNSDKWSFNYEVGIFIEGKLVAAKKFFKPIIYNASCSYSKFNINAVVKDPSLFTKPAGEINTYRVQLAVRPLPRPSGSSYTRLVFGDVAGQQAGGMLCVNITPFQARAVMDISTIERKK